ncbi:hypothetical protein A3747_20390 [Sulfitobacter sp. HI0076]|nr:hypothetical protein A3747_20390 [Sulfitobacter sp. HI0076]
MIEKLNNLIVNKPGTPVGYGAPDSGWIICAMNTQKGVTATRLKEIQGPRSQRVAQTARHSIAKWAIFLRLTTQHARSRGPTWPFFFRPYVEFSCLVKTWATDPDSISNCSIIGLGPEKCKLAWNYMYFVGSSARWYGHYLRQKFWW